MAHTKQSAGFALKRSPYFWHSFELPAHPQTDSRREFVEAGEPTGWAMLDEQHEIEADATNLGSL